MASQTQETAEQRKARLANETPEQKIDRVNAERAERQSVTRGKVADGIDKSIRTIKMSSAKLDEGSDAETIVTVESALDTLRSVRDGLRSNGVEPAAEANTDEGGEASTDEGDKPNEGGKAADKGK